MTDTLTKIAALLRHAESTKVEAERETYMAKAQGLATLAAIDLAEARAYVPAHERTEKPTVEQIWIANAATPKKGLATYVSLFMAIGKANDLRFTIAQNSRYVNVFGFPSDIETTKAIYASVVVQMVASSDAYIHSGSYKTERVWTSRKDAWGTPQYGYYPVHGSTARISFQDSYAVTIGRRLSQARADAIKAREAIKPVGAAALPAPLPPEPSTSTVLVLKAKAEEVNSFYDKNNNARGSWKGGSSSHRCSLSAAAGQHAATRADLGRRRAVGAA